MTFSMTSDSAPAITDFADTVAEQQPSEAEILEALKQKKVPSSAWEGCVHNLKNTASMLNHVRLFHPECLKEGVSARSTSEDKDGSPKADPKTLEDFCLEMVLKEHTLKMVEDMRAELKSAVQHVEEVGPKGRRRPAPFRTPAQETVTRWSSTLAAMITLICNHRAMTICAALHAGDGKPYPEPLSADELTVFVQLRACMTPLRHASRLLESESIYDHLGKSIQKFDLKEPSSKKRQPPAVDNKAPAKKKREPPAVDKASFRASTKRQRGDWREEVDGEEETAGTAAKADGDDDDSEEAILDPGTPLPSEEEEDPAAAAPEAPPATEPPAEATEEAPAAEAEAVPTEPAATKAEETSAPADAGGPAPKAVVATLDVIVGKNKVGQLRVLLPLGLDPDVEQRLQACAGPDGGVVDFLSPGALCGFGGHEIPGVKEKEKEKKKKKEADAGTFGALNFGAVALSESRIAGSKGPGMQGFLQSAAAFRLRQLGVEAKLEVWEKARGPGGRMSTNRQEVEGSTVRADMGAQRLGQYISMDPTDTASSQVSELLLSKGVCTKVSAADLSGTPERPRDWHHLAGAAGGVNDALKTLIEEAGATPHYEKRVAALDLQNGVWRARPFDGAFGFFDAVLLAVPGCGVGGDNLNKIHGSWEGMLKPEQNKQLTAVQHDHRWSFAFFLPGDCAAACESFFGPTSLEKLVDDEVVHLLCYQSRKVAVASGTKPGAVTVVAHTSLEWAKRHARDSGRDDRLLKEVAAHVRQLLQIDGPLTKLTATSKVITWKQCQVTKAVPTLPDGPCMVVSASPPLLLAGDTLGLGVGF
ncbi:RNLS, partial [Symbiodinium microadriaticum]